MQARDIRAGRTVKCAENCSRSQRPSLSLPPPTPAASPTSTTIYLPTYLPTHHHHQHRRRRRRCIRNPANCTYVARRYNLILLGNLAATINFPPPRRERDLPIAPETRTVDKSNSACFLSLSLPFPLSLSSASCPRFPDCIAQAMCAETRPRYMCTRVKSETDSDATEKKKKKKPNKTTLQPDTLTLARRKVHC